MKHRQQEAPNAVQVEPSEGCNLRCEFCGLRGIREEGSDKGYKFMTVQTAERLGAEMKRLGWTSRLELAMHGEPTMNMHLPNIVAVLRMRLPRNSIMLTTNGGGLLGAGGPIVRATALFDAGVNTIAVDDYKAVQIGAKLRFGLNGAPFQILDYPKDPTASPHSRQPPKSRRLIFIEDISVAEQGTHSALNNHAGAAAPPEQLKARCAKPFRELSLRWDGSVAICCNDWRGVYKVANLNQTPLDALWQHPRLEAARRLLYLGDRASLAPCDACNAKSYRVGLLPDRMGKETMPKPDAGTRALVKQATGGNPYTPAVKRDWEAK